MLRRCKSPLERPPPTSLRNPHLNRASTTVGHNLISQPYLFTLRYG